jgi:hypothetical protein
MKRRGLAALAIVALLVLPGCASLGGPRHASTVGLVSLHSVLSAIQDTEMRIVCGRAGAPSSPLCVPVPTHRQISAHLEQAFILEIRAAQIVRALPPGTPQPTEVVTILVQVNALVQQVMALLPDGRDKAALVQSIGGSK